MWIPSHIDLAEAVAIEARGGLERIHLVGNFWVDAKAKEGMAFHPINDREYHQAEDRAFLACLGPQHD